MLRDLRFDVVRSLGRVEMRELLLGPAFWLGFAFIGVFAIQAGLGLTLGREPGSDPVDVGALVVVAVGIGLFVATPMGANASALRTDRSGLREQFGSLPSVPETRTAGLLVALLLGPVALTVLLSVVAYPVFRSWPELREHVDVALLAQAPLTTLGLGAVGIGLARWFRHPIGGPLIIVAHVFTPLIWGVPWIAPTTSGIRMGWHYTYLVAEIVLWASIAFAGDRRRDHRRLIVPAAALAVVILAAARQIPEGGLV